MSVVPGLDVYLFIPTYNEAENVDEVVRAAHAALARSVTGSFRVVVVDDASPDGTGALADGLAAELDEVEVVHRPTKQGLGRAYLAGLQHALAAGAQLVMVMDADLSHDPGEIGTLLAAAQSADVVIGSRYVAGGRVLDWPPLRRTLSRLGSLYARTLLGMDTADLTGGFRAFRRCVLEAVELRTLRSQGYVFNIELAYRAHRAGFALAEVPITFRERRRGQSKISLAIAIEALWLVPTLRFRRLARLWPSRSTPLADPTLAPELAHMPIAPGPDLAQAERRATSGGQ